MTAIRRSILSLIASSIDCRRGSEVTAQCDALGECSRLHVRDELAAWANDACHRISDTSLRLHNELPSAAWRIRSVQPNFL
jgi:hypothetical protein